MLGRKPHMQTALKLDRQVLGTVFVHFAKGSLFIKLVPGVPEAVSGTQDPKTALRQLWTGPGNPGTGP